LLVLLHVLGWLSEKKFSAKRLNTDVLPALLSPIRRSFAIGSPWRMEVVDVGPDGFINIIYLII